MKAPDKIYMTTLSANKVYGNNWGCWTDRECPGETYIRKDALLEWLKEKVEWYEGTELSEVYQKVIDKLNSM